MAASRLEDFISSVITAPTNEESKRRTINHTAEIRTFIRSCEDFYKPRLIAKVVFLALRGENTHWASVEIINLMNHERNSYKRIGYLACEVCLDSNSEIVTLVTAIIQKDLKADTFAKILALTFIANMVSEEIAETCAPQVVHLTEHYDYQIKKAALMAGVQMIRKCPNIVDSFVPCVNRAMENSMHSVVSAGLFLMQEIIRVKSDLRGSFVHHIPLLTSRLQKLFNTNVIGQYKFGSTTLCDPFLQINIMKALTALKASSEELDSVLSKIVTTVDSLKNSGRAVLLQCVSTIGAVAHKQSLHSLAYNQIGRLFNIRQPNIIYSALSAFSNILYNENKIFDRSSADSIVLQRYKSQVVQCLDHRDGSIRRRALDVIALLVDENNAQSLIPELIVYITMADKEFRSDLISKIFNALTRFSPSNEFTLRQSLSILVEGGNSVPTDVIVNLSKLFIKNLAMQQFALPLFKSAVKTNTQNQPLLQITAFLIGEYDTNPESLQILMDLSKALKLSDDTLLYIITAVAKLSVRCNIIAEGSSFLEKYTKSFSLEVQQRSHEYLAIMRLPNAGSILHTIEDQNEGSEQVSTQTPKNEYTDLLSFIASNNNSQNNVKPKSSIESLLDILDDKSNKKDANIVQGSQSSNSVSSPPGSVLAQKNQDYSIFFEIKNNNGDPNQLAIRSTVVSTCHKQLTKFQVQFGVPQGWLIQAQKPSGEILEPSGGNSITQILMLLNKGTNPLQMKTLVTYMYGAQIVKEQGAINPIFG